MKEVIFFLALFEGEKLRSEEDYWNLECFSADDIVAEQGYFV